MDAGSLENIVKIYNLAKVKPQIDESILVKIALQMLCGLAYLHSNNQLHRDVKSANVLINTKGEIKLTDFGIAKQIDEDKEFTKTSVGTRSYMSPERIKGEEYGPKSDIWGFGLIMYELATG
jgi:serine/threonine protein kinase